MDDHQLPLQRLNPAASAQQYTRRQILARAAGLGLSAPAIAALLEACTPASAAAAAAKPAGKEKSLNIRLQLDMKVVDPANTGQNSDHAIGLLVFNGLVKYEVGGLNVVPDLATDWKIDESGKVYTFRMRKGVKWHKGFGEVTANDVVYSINRIKDPATKSRFAVDVGIIDKVEAVDPYTVRFILKRPFSPFLSAVLAFRPGWIVNKKAVEQLGERFATGPVGSGPYVFEKWSRGTEVVLRRNPDYFEPLDIDKVVFKVVNQDTVAELALKSGELDVAYLYEGEAATRILNEKGGNVESKSLPGYRTQWATFNLRRPLMQDVRVRKALIHAIDKKATAKAVYSSLGQAVASLFNPNIPGWIDIDPFPYDPAKAKQLLAEAGFASGLNLKVVPMPSVGWPEMATVLQDQWKKVGVTAELVIRERAVYDELTKGSDFDIDATNISRADAFQYAAYLYGPNVPFPNNGGYKGADALIDAAAREMDTAKRLELWRQFQQKALVEDVAGFGMTNVRYVLAWRKGIKGVDAMYQDSFPVWKMSL